MYRHIQTEHVLYGHRVTCEHTGDFALHCHPMYECYYFVSGEVRYLVEGVPYSPEPGSLLLMAGGVFHGIRVETDMPYERYTLHFDESYLPAELREALLMPFHAGNIYHAQAGTYGLETYFAAIEDCQEIESSLREVALSARIAALLSQVCRVWEAADNLFEQPEGQALDRQIVAYVNASLTEPLTLDGIARHFFISRNHLCRSFLRTTGTTVGAYIRHKRLALAELLRAQGQSAAEAAANAGFRDYSTYYRTHCRLMRHAPTRQGRPSAR